MFPRTGGFSLAFPRPILIVTAYSLIGFEEFGNSDSFQTAALELRLQQSGKCSTHRLFLVLLKHDFSAGVVDKMDAVNVSLQTPYGSEPSRIRRGAETNDDDSDLDL